MWHSNNLKTILNLNLSKNIGDSKSYFPLKRLLNENSLAVSNHVNAHNTRNLFLGIKDNKVHALTFYRLLGEKHLSSFPLD